MTMSKKIYVELNDEQYRKLIALANQTDRTNASLVRHVVNRYLNQYKIMDN